MSYWEHGRAYGTFHQGQYPFPIDELENDRLDIMHKFFRVARQDVLTNGLPPPSAPPPRILDLGTGTGIWAIEMAEELGDRADIVGVDLHPSQPPNIPRSCRFAHAVDIEMPWAGIPEDFNLIHMRTLNGSIADWTSLYARAFRHLAPGGKIEQVEIDFAPRTTSEPLPPDFSLVEWYESLMAAMDRAGRPMRLDHHTGAKLEAAGFTDVQEATIRIPISPWANNHHERETGRWFNLALRQGIEALTLGPFTRHLNRRVPDIENLVGRLTNDLQQSHRYEIYCVMHIWLGTKPDRRRQ